MDFEDENSLDLFIESVEIMLAEKPIQIKIESSDYKEKQPFLFAPTFNNEKSVRIPILKKNESPRREGFSTHDCRKCELYKKQLDDRLLLLEEKMTNQFNELFESYSHLAKQIHILKNGN